jgi:TetR/AcrR family transcriptional regulator
MFSLLFWKVSRGSPFNDITTGGGCQRRVGRDRLAAMQSPASPLFDRLAEDKRRAILGAAAAEFARAGFTAAKVDDIAARSGVSVGALYKYFGSKENCFLAVLDDGVKELEARLDQVMGGEAEPWARIEAIVRLIPEHSRRHAEVLRLYHEIGGEGLSALGRDFCRRFEGLSARCYSALLAEARAAGLARPGLDEDYAAFFLDNVFIALQFSFSCDYHKLRKAVYLGPEKDADDESLVARTLEFLRYGLAGHDFP